MASYSDPNHSIKRQRTTISCSVCRKRKSKCDRQRPVCGSCKKKSIAHLCSFEDDPTPSQTQYFTVMSSPGTFSNGSPPFFTVPGSNFEALHMNGSPLMTSMSENGTKPSFSAAGNIPSPGNVWPSASLSYFENTGMQPQGFQQPRAIASHMPEPNFLDLPGARPEAPILQDPPVKPGATYVFTPLRPRENSVMDEMKSESRPRSDSISSAPHNLRHHPSVSSEASNGSFSSKKRHNSLLVPGPASESSQTPVISNDASRAGPKNPTRVGLESMLLGHEEAPSKNSDFSLNSAIMDHSSSTSRIMQQTESMNFSSDRSDYSFQSSTKPFFSQNFDYNTLKFATVSIGSNSLRIAVEDTMDAFSCASSTLLVEGSHWQQQGPLSYVGLTKRDQFFGLVRNFTVRLFRSEQFSRYVSKNQQSSLGDKRLNGERSSLDPKSQEFNEDPESESDILNEDSLVTLKIQHEKERNDDSDGYITGNFSGIQSFSTLYQSKKMYYNFVEEKLLSLLPSKMAISEAINKYFQYVHPFVPLFHEPFFMKEIESLFIKDPLNSEVYGKPKHITIQNDSMLNLAGQLLLVVRLGYMTLIPNNNTQRRYTKVEKKLIKEVTMVKANDYLIIVHLCIPEEKVQVKSTFKLVQSLVLLFFYRSVAPNDCLGLSGSDSQLLHGAIINHALSIGLNRDPLKYNTISSVPKDASFVIRWRCLWSYIVNLDALNSMYCGMPLKLPDLDISDTEKPSYENSSEKVSQFSKTVDNVCLCYRRIVKKVTNLKSKVKVVDLLTETSKLEKIFLDIFGKDFFKEYICGSAPEEAINRNGPEGRQRNEEAYLKVHRFLLFINTRANLSCLYYLVVIHYEQLLDSDPAAEAQAGIELFKIFIRSVVQLVYIMSYVLDNMHELFGDSYDYLLTSRIERSMIKTHTFVSAFFIRLVNYKRTLALKEMTGKALASNNEENFEERCDIVDSLFTIILLEAELFVGNFRTLSKTYINSYKLYVMAFFVLKQCMEDPGILLAGVTNSKESFFNDGTNLIQFLSNSELQSLCKLCEEFRLAKLESVRRQKEHEMGHKNKKNQNSGTEKSSSDDMTAETSESSVDDDNSSETSGIFDVTQANRAMYANEDTVNTYGSLKEKHLGEEFQGEVFDEQNMIGNDELLQLFDTYGLLDG